MRLWSLHPKYLDPQGLTALWREGLLAQKVLQGKTRGYRHHPQLERFKAQRHPGAAIASYLKAVFNEASRRGYAFDAEKLGVTRARAEKITVTRGQLAYEFEWLCIKLAVRNPAYLKEIQDIKTPAPHPDFRVVDGPIAVWERLKDNDRMLGADCCGDL